MFVGATSTNSLTLSFRIYSAMGFFRSCSPPRGRVSATQGEERGWLAQDRTFSTSQHLHSLLPKWPVKAPPQPPPKDPESLGSYLGRTSPCSAVFVHLVEEGALQSWLPCGPVLPFPSSPLI